MGEASRQAWLLIDMKRKYWAKALSNNALLSNLDLLFDLFDFLAFLGDWWLSDSLFSSLLSAIELDIPLLDIEPWNLEWEVELPDVDELLKGVLIKLEKLDVSDIIKEKLPQFEGIETDVDKLIDNIFEPEYAKNFKESRIAKGYYGKSKYEQAYYDPTAVREFFRATLYHFSKKRQSFDTILKKVETTARNLDINPELARIIFDRLIYMDSLLYQAAAWDYGWWDRSVWTPGDTGHPVSITTYERAQVELEFDDVFDALGGGYWDHDVWDFAWWTGDSPKDRHPWKRENNVLIMLKDEVWSNYVSRITTIAFGVANYQPYQVRKTFQPSDRLEVYALGVAQRQQVERIVRQIVQQYEPGCPPIRLRLYITAALFVLSRKYTDNRWGLEMFRALSEQEFKQWWLDYWSRQGLDPRVLDIIYNVISRPITAMGRARAIEKFRFIRKYLRGRR